MARSGLCSVLAARCFNCRQPRKGGLAVGDISDVVIVGGGIAGSSLAYALASAGRRVTVLESSVEYEDRVRGETVMPWG